MVVCEEKDALLNRIDSKEIVFVLDREIQNIPESLSAFSAFIKNSRTISVKYRPQEQHVGEIIDALKKEKISIVDITTEQSDLEDVFLQLTGT